MTRREWLAAMTGAIVLAVVALPGVRVARAESSAAPAAVAATPEEAVRLSVEAGGEVFSGLCGQAISPRDLGKVCARFVEERGGMRAYLTGRTFSEFSHWLFVVRTPDGWQPAGSVPLDFFAQPDIPWPATADTSHA